MPQYKVQDPTTGMTLSLQGDSPPTEQELQTIFSQAGRGQNLNPTAFGQGSREQPNVQRAGIMDVLESGAAGLGNFLVNLPGTVFGGNQLKIGAPEPRHPFGAGVSVIPPIPENRHK